MAFLSGDEAAKRLGITLVKGVRSGIVVGRDGEPHILVQFKRDDDTTTPSYTMPVSTAIDLIASLTNKLEALSDPEKFTAFAADRAKTSDDHNPPAT